jgi:hypothetical protein
MSTKRKTTTKRPRGRPSTFTWTVANEICGRLSKGETLRSICRDKGMPDEAVVRGWALDDREGFYSHYARARDLGLDAMADGLLDIADNGTNDYVEKNDPGNPGYRFNGEHQQRSRLRVDTRKWYLSKLAPKRYGDRSSLELTGANGGPVAIDDTERATKLAGLLALANQRKAKQEGEDGES